MDIHNISLTIFPYDIEYVKDKFISAIGEEYNMLFFDSYKGFINEYYTQQYNAPREQFILYTPTSNPHSTIMFANIMDGYVSLVKYVSKTCGMKYYNVLISDGWSNWMEAYHFDYYSPMKTRHILCYRDPQWVFYEEGEPLEFENVELYKSRLKKNRLNKEIILQYLNYLGWDIQQNDFWKPIYGCYLFDKKHNTI